MFNEKRNIKIYPSMSITLNKEIYSYCNAKINTNSVKNQVNKKNPNPPIASLDNLERPRELNSL